MSGKSKSRTVTSSEMPAREQVNQVVALSSYLFYVPYFHLILNTSTGLGCHWIIIIIIIIIIIPIPIPSSELRPLMVPPSIDRMIKYGASVECGLGTTSLVALPILEFNPVLRGKLCYGRIPAVHN
jgi:hypothetical protein